MPNALEQAALSAQAAAGRAHQELMDAKLAKASPEAVAALQSNFERAAKIEAAAHARYAA